MYLKLWACLKLHQDFWFLLFLLNIKSVIVLSILHIKHANKYYYQQLKDVKFGLKADSELEKKKFQLEFTLCPKLNSHYKARSCKKKKNKNVKAYRKSV